MIPGDIDLTENLDFRKSRKKEIPKLPWNKNNISAINESDITITLDNSANAIITYYNYDEYGVRHNNVYYDEILSLYDGTTSYNFISDNESFTTTSTLLTSLRLKFNETKKDVFGNIIKKDKPIKNICWSAFNKIKEVIPIIPWKRSYNDYRIYSIKFNNTNNKIPWETSMHIKINDNPICYLNGKSNSFIDEYFHKRDNSNYLTDMNWLRIHDAIIE